MINAGNVMSYMDFDTSRFKRELDGVIKDLSTFSDKSRSIDERINALGGSMGAFGSRLTRDVTVPLTGLSSAAVKFFGDFEEGVNKITTLDTSNILDVPKLKKDLLELSDDVGTSVEGINEATYQMGSALGAVSDDIVDYTAVAAKAARAGFTETDIAVDGLSTALNVYGDKSIETMQKYADIMLNAQNLGKIFCSVTEKSVA